MATTQGRWDVPLPTGKSEVSLSAMSFLFSELVQYSQARSARSIVELERRLEDVGYEVGERMLEVLCLREKGRRRETRILGILGFLHTSVWKSLFGKVADALEKGVTEEDDEYMISDNDLVLNRFISVPKEMENSVNGGGSFAAGVVRGVLDAAGFPARVTAHAMPLPGTPAAATVGPGNTVSVPSRVRTTILIKLDRSVLQREARLAA